MKKLLSIAIIAMAIVLSCSAQNIKVFNGRFEWGQDQITKQLNFFSDQELTVNHVKIVTEDNVILYEHEVSWPFSHPGNVVTISMTVDDPLRNFVEIFWDIYVSYTQRDETHVVRYRIRHTTMYDVTPHRLSDQIFIPWYGDYQEQTGTTTAVREHMTPRGRFEYVCKYGPIGIRKDGKKKIIKLGER